MFKTVASVLLIPLVHDNIVTLVVRSSFFFFPTVLLSKFVIGINKCWKESNFEIKNGNWKGTLQELSPLLDLQIWGDSG